MLSSALDYAQFSILGVFHIDPWHIYFLKLFFLRSIDSIYDEVITYALQNGRILRTRQRL